MQLRLALLLSVILVFNVVRAQDNPCNCRSNLDSTILKTETNYAGYPAKVNASTGPAYQKLVSTLRQKAAREVNPKKCFSLIREYVRFFKDKHFIFSYYNPADFDSTVIPVSEASMKKPAVAKTMDAFEGIWINPDSSTRIAIRKMPDGSYKALKLASTADTFPVGFVYFSITKEKNRWVAKEYNSFVSTSTPVLQVGRLLQLWNHAIWGKVFPQTMSAAEAVELASWKNGNNGLAFRKINPDVAYLKVPSFFNNDAAIQQLVAAHDSVIRTTPYLIVDLTGNGGGNTGWVSFLSYFMTNPIVQHPSYLRVTPDNVKLKRPDLEYYVNNPIPDEYKKYFPEETLNQYKKAYAELPVTREEFYPIPGVTFPLDSITRSPKKIALLVDNLCGSSTEYFFQLSKQSSKTIRYGLPTTGMMDYEGMSTPTPLPYDKFILTIPIVRSSWTATQPIDQTGFVPDVLLNKVPREKWIQWVAADIQKRP